jgi:hypothetical protein
MRSPVSIPAAGQLMLAQVLMQENKGSAVRINLLFLFSTPDLANL